MDAETRTSATTAAPAIRAFPWSAVARLSRDDVASLRDVRGWLGAEGRRAGWAEAVREVVGASIGVRIEGVRAATRPQMAGALAVVLLRNDRGPSPEPLLLEVDAALATTVLAKVLRRRPPKAVAPSWNVPQAIAGAFAALVVAVARRAPRGEAMVVREAGLAASLRGPSGEAAPDRWAGLGRDWASVDLTVTLDGEPFAARLVARRSRMRAGRGAFDARALESLGTMPLSIPIVACVATSAREEIEALVPGDVFLPGSWPLSLPGKAETAETSERHPVRVRGSVLLAAPGEASRGVRAVFGDAGRLVLSGEIEPLAAAEADMGDGEETASIQSAVGDVPVVVRVEIGEARMLAREWAALRPGDVVTVGTRVGEAVVLRVGGVPVARGQLVEVDGEVGVRIEERIVEGRTTA
jgi:flagellar motor switch/type III secretory pathway protein FliN